MKVKIYIIPVLLLLIFSSCSSYVKVSSDNVKYENLKTFAWDKNNIEIKDVLLNSEQVNQIIKGTVEAAFSETEIKKVNENPDFLIKVESITEQRSDTTRGNPAYYAPGLHPYPGGIYPYSGGRPGRNISNVKIDTYLHETLKISFLDPDNKTVLWQGVFESRTAKNGFYKQLVRAIHSVMKKYPPIKGG